MGPKIIFERNSNLNGTDFGDCDVEVATAAREFYFQGNITSEDLKQYINLWSDVEVWFGTEKMIQYLTGHVPLYHYILYFQDLFSITLDPNVLGRDLGVSHMDETFYIWDMYGLNAHTGVIDSWWSEANKINSKRMLEMWTNFVKYLNPTPGIYSSVYLGDFVWEQVTPSYHSYLRIDEILEMEMTSEYMERMQFWDKVLTDCRDISKL
jgi:hypothetical protein